MTKETCICGNCGKDKLVTSFITSNPINGVSWCNYCQRGGAKFPKAKSVKTRCMKCRSKIMGNHKWAFCEPCKRLPAYTEGDDFDNHSVGTGMADGGII